MFLHYLIKLCIIFIIIIIVLFLCNIFKTKKLIIGGRTYKDKLEFKKVNLLFQNAEISKIATLINKYTQLCKKEKKYCFDECENVVEVFYGFITTLINKKPSNRKQILSMFDKIIHIDNIEWDKFFNIRKKILLTKCKLAKDKKNYNVLHLMFKKPNYVSVDYFKLIGTWSEICHNIKNDDNTYKSGLKTQEENKKLCINLCDKIIQYIITIGSLDIFNPLDRAYIKLLKKKCAIAKQTNDINTIKYLLNHDALKVIMFNRNLLDYIYKSIYSVTNSPSTINDTPINTSTNIPINTSTNIPTNISHHTGNN